MKRATMKKIYPFAAVLVVWAAVHVNSINWGLPAAGFCAPDGVSARPDDDAAALMRSVGFKYPPLQFLIYDCVIPDKEVAGLTPAEFVEECSVCQRRMRWVNAVMALLTALLVYLFTVLAFDDLRAAVSAALLFTLNPMSLYYSLTTNMDQGYLFWMTVSGLVLYCSERHRGESSRLTYWSLQAAFAASASPFAPRTRRTLFTSCRRWFF